MVTLDQTQKKEVILFYLGTFFSSIGSMTYLVCAMAFMIKAGLSTFEVGLFVGATRFFPILSTLLLGDISDRISPRKLIIVSEVLASIISLGLILAWTNISYSVIPFISLSMIRACILSIQAPSKSKIAKIIAGADYSKNSLTAIWLNKVTHGSALFAAIIGFVFVTKLTMVHVLAFDFLTFLINGIIVWKLSIGSTKGSDSINFRFFEKFKYLYRYSQRAATLDILLALVMCGANLFSTRIAGTREELIPLFLGSYGLAVWTSGFLERWAPIRKAHISVWVVLGLSYVFLGQLADTGWAALFVYFISDSAYWLLFHRYSAHIQTDAPPEKAAAIFSARIIQMLIVLSLGEFVVGFWSQYVSVEWDATWRAVLCLIVAIMLVKIKSVKVNKNASEI